MSSSTSASLGTPIIPTARSAGAGRTGLSVRIDPGRRPRSWVEITQGARGSRLCRLILLSLGMANHRRRARLKGKNTSPGSASEPLHEQLANEVGDQAGDVPAVPGYLLEPAGRQE